MCWRETACCSCRTGRRRPDDDEDLEILRPGERARMARWTVPPGRAQGTPADGRASRARPKRSPTCAGSLHLRPPGERAVMTPSVPTWARPPVRVDVRGGWSLIRAWRAVSRMSLQAIPVLFGRTWCPALACSRSRSCAAKPRGSRTTHGAVVCARSAWCLGQLRLITRCSTRPTGRRTGRQSVAVRTRASATVLLRYVLRERTNARARTALLLAAAAVAIACWSSDRLSPRSV